MQRTTGARRGVNVGRRIWTVGMAVISLFAVGGPGEVWGHVTDTDMPDAVAEMEYQILLDFQPEKTEVRNKLAMVLLRKKKFSEAEAEFRKVLQVQPANVDARDGLGLVLLETDRTAEAVGEFQAAVQTNPKDVMAHYHLGQAYERQGDRDSAQQAYQQALTLAEQPVGGKPAAVSAAEIAAIRKALAPPGAPSAIPAPK